MERVRAAREAIGPNAELFVDANGAYDRKQALAKAAAFADLGVSWFEEPVSSDDLEGLRLIREQAPAGMRIAAGEYGYDSFYFRRMLEAERSRRAAGGRHALRRHNRLPRRGQFVRVLLNAVLCAYRAFAARARSVRHSLRDERRVFFRPLQDRADVLRRRARGHQGGMLRPDAARPGFGLECKLPDMEKYRVYGNTPA